MTAKVALVAGSSSGIGRAAADALHWAGWQVIGGSRTGAGRPTSGWHAVSLDVDDDASVRDFVEAAVASLGRVDLLVNAAGYGLAGAVEDTTADEARAQLETNVLGVHRACRAVLPHMRRQGRGTIVTIGSLAGQVGLPFQAFYSASKFALEGYCEALRIEVAAFGIKVAIVEPGDMATGFTAARRLSAETAAGTVYDTRRAEALGIMARDEQAGPAPAAAGALVVRIASARNPRLRYTVGRRSQVAGTLAKRVLPHRAFEAGLRKTYGLG
jgi:NAD(P)-dependent dehydrogenase (short-subunit alcohol dehydrogenase family)